MKNINLTQGLSAMVDDNDFEALNAFKWHAHKDRSTYYAARQISIRNGQQRLILMHRIIINTPIEMVTDHIDRDGLNNQRYNLRSVTVSENAFNTKAKGYSFHKREQKFRARIMVNGKSKHLGDFKTEQEARQSYLDAKEIYHAINN